MNATTPTSATAATGTILALDLGKYKTVACAYDRLTADARFHPLDTTREELRRPFDAQRPALSIEVAP